MNDIPESFHSLETDSPFSNCIDCKCELIASGTTYMVQKNFAGDECILEYALCEACKVKLDEQISAKSKEALYDFLFDNAEMVNAPADYGLDDAMQQIEECLTCGKQRGDCKEYSYSGLFIGSTLVPGPMPMMICDDCQEQISENLSEETKDVRDKFLAEHFPGPPSEVDLPKTRKPILF